MDQPPTDTPPPARPAPTRETVGELVLIIAKVIVAVQQMQASTTARDVALKRKIEGDAAGEAEASAAASRLGADASERLGAAMEDLQAALERFAGGLNA